MKNLLLFIFTILLFFSCSDDKIEEPESPYKVDILLAEVYNFEITNCQYFTNSDSLIEVTAEDSLGNWFILKIEKSKTDSSQIMYRAGETIYKGNVFADHNKDGDDLVGKYVGLIYGNNGNLKVSGEFRAKQDNDDIEKDSVGMFYVSKVSMDWENEEGQVTYYLPMKAQVKAEVYDLTGKIASSIYDQEWMSAGVHKLKIDFKPLQNGAYIFLFEALGQQKIEKFVVTRSFVVRKPK